MNIKYILLIFSLIITDQAFAAPDPDTMQEDQMMQSMEKNNTLNLPSNATSIRMEIVDTFSCMNKSYGYYADVDNDCQVFHVCVPVVYADGKTGLFRYSFICPNETYFDQSIFVCVRELDMVVTCEEAAQYYYLNDNFGQKEDEMEGSGASDSASMDMMDKNTVEREEEKPGKRKWISRNSERRQPKIDPEIL